MPTSTELRSLLARSSRPTETGRTVAFLLLTGVLVCASGTGCSGEESDADADTECTGARCDDDNGGGRDVGRPDAGGGEDDTDEGTPDTDDGTCSPGEQVCVDGQTAGVCLADGVNVTPIPCTNGQVCRDGVCAEPSETLCEPGEVSACAASGSLLRCNNEGTAFVEEACPGDAPFCRDGACTANLCTPNVRSCRGNDVVVCNGAGDAQTVETTCPIACRDGACTEVSDCTFDGKYYLGCDFWAVYLDNEARGLSFGVTVSNPGTREVRVDVLGPGDASLYSGVVDAGGLQFIDLSTAVQLDSSGITDSAYRVRADGPVTVHQFNPPNNLVQGFSNDASLLLPANALGTEYRVMAYHSGDDLAIFARLSARWYVTIVATSEGSTDVTVESPAAIRAGAGVTAMAAGETRTFTLTRGQVLTLMANENNGDDPDPGDPADLTGMRISGTQPIAVFSGSEASYIPDDTGAADHLEQQLYPVDTWGNEYTVAKFAARGGEPDVFRVMSSVPNTTITTVPAIPNVSGRTLANAGDALEFNYATDFVLTASAPVSLGQFMVGSLYPGFQGRCSGTVTEGCLIPLAPECGNTKRIGDPAFLLPVSNSQFRSDYTFLTPEGYTEDWVSIVMPTGASVTLDGSVVTATPTTIPGTTWQVIRVEVEPGTHTLTSSAPVGLSVYGYGCDVSYAYPGGLNLETE
jgi:hypothetical protein